MAQTKLTNLINPQVMGDMISATLPKKIKFSRIAKIDNTLVGVPGDTITVPKYAYIGDAEDVAEGVSMGTTVLTASTTTATVKKAGKAIEITDEAALSAYGEPESEGGKQLTMSIAAKVDNDCLAALLTASLTYNGTANKIAYDGVVDAVDKFDSESDDGINGVIYVAPEQVTTIRKDSNFLDINKYPITNGVIMTGVIGQIAGFQVVPSKKVVKVGYTMAVSTTPNAILIVAESATPGSGEAKLSSLTAGAFWDAATKSVVTPAVGDYVLAATNPYFLNPLVVIGAEDPNENPSADGFDVEVPALTIYMKRDVMVESDRDILAKTTVVSADEHFTAVLSNDSKVVLASFKA